MTPLPRPARWLLALPYLAGMGAWALARGGVEGGGTGRIAYALAQAREEGRREGIEQAAKVLGDIRREENRSLGDDLLDLCDSIAITREAEDE